MISDRFGGVHDPAMREAIGDYELAVRAFLRHRPSMASLDLALMHQTDFLAPRLLKGFFNLLLARRETLAAVREDIPFIKARAVHAPASDRDVVMADVLALAVEGDSEAAIAQLRTFAEANPHDLLIIKLVHALQFITGRSEEMAGFTARMLHHWSPNSEGYGYLLGCHAFGLEEHGTFAEAEAAATASLHYDRQDLWAMHALAHVYEMNGRNREGIIWVESARELWCDAPNFSFHLAWHLALFNHNAGKTNRALEIYDLDVRASKSEDFRDIANAASLLWRLRQDGVDVGRRFEELAAIAECRRDDVTLIFGTLHHLLSLLAAGKFEAARELLSSIESTGKQSTGTQARVAREIGAPLARSLLAVATGERPIDNIAQMVSCLPQLGGSNTQRDVFMRELAMLSIGRGDQKSLDVVLGQRHLNRREDRFFQFVQGQNLTNSNGPGPSRRVA